MASPHDISDQSQTQETTKYCTKCEKVKPATAFYRRGGTGGKLRTPCKTCIRTQGRVLRARNSARPESDLNDPDIAKSAKTCSDCRHTKPISDFHRNRSHKDSRSGICKKCALIRDNAWKAKNRESARASVNRSYAKHRISRLAKDKTYQSANPFKMQARWAVKDAVKSGKLIRPSSCSKCGDKCHPHAHHNSYLPDHRLDVVWLCALCHMAMHADEKR